MSNTVAKEPDARKFIPDFFDGKPEPIDAFTKPDMCADFDLKQFNIDKL
jgi:hypothetical protein